MTDFLRVPCKPAEFELVCLSSKAVSTAPSLRGSFRSPTLRQYDVLVARVHHGGEIAAARALGLSPYTVKIQLEYLRDAWGARNTTHLVALVYKHVVVGFVWWLA